MTESQRRLANSLAEVAEIDEVIAAIRVQEDRDNERRRLLSLRRQELGKQIGELFTKAHHPDVAIVVGGRVFIRDMHLGMMTLPIITVAALEALANPTPRSQPELPEILIGHPMSTTSIPARSTPEFSEEEA